MSILLVCNPASGQGRISPVPVIELALKREGRAYTHYATAAEDTVQGIRDVLAAASYQEAWAVGGDGTVNNVLNAMGGHPLPMAIIPAGSGNDYSRTIYPEKFTLQQQIMTALNGPLRPVDAGRCNGRFFLNGVGMGFDGAVAERMVRSRRLHGHAAYYASVMQLLPFYQEKRATLRVDGVERENRYFMLTVANGHTFGGGFRVTPNSKPDDGLLEISLITEVDFLSRLRHLKKVEKGTHGGLRFVEFLQGQKVNIQWEQEVPGHIDGEMMQAQEFDIEILPQWIRLRHPA